MRNIFESIGRVVVRFRWLVLVGWIAAAIAVSVFFPTLASVSKSNNSDFLPSNSPSIKAANLATPFGRSDETSIPVIVLRAESPLAASDQQTIAALTTNLSKVPRVISVKDAGRSRDGYADELRVVTSFSRGPDASAKSLIENLRSAISTTPTSGLQVHLAGQIASQVDSQGQRSRSGAVDLFSIIFILVLLTVIFRSLLAPLLTLAPAVVANVMAGPIIAELAKAGLKVSALSQVMLVVLVLGAGTDYGLFLIFRVREEMQGGLSHRDAVVKALGRVGESIVFSAGTVIAALLSLLLATFGIYQSLGMPLAIAIVTMLLTGLTLAPALLAIFGRAVFWPAKPRPGNSKTGLWGRVASTVVNRPVLTLIVGVVGFGGLAIASLGNQPAGFDSGTSSPAGTDSAAGNAALSAHFPQSASNPTNVLFALAQPVWENRTTLTRIKEGLSSSGKFTSVTGPLDPNGVAISADQLVSLHDELGDPRALPVDKPAPTKVSSSLYATYRATANYVSADGKTVQYLGSLVAGDPSSTKAINSIPSLRKAVAGVAQNVGATNWGITGLAPAAYDINSTSDNDLLRVVPVAVIVIGILLAIVMRSLIAPLYLIASVAVSYLAALGVAVIAFIYIGNSGGLTFILPFLMFIFLLALGEDYNILVMTRIREEAHHLPLREAVQRALSITGTTVTSAGLVLAGTFAVFAIVGGDSQVRDIGTGLAVGIVMDTFLVRTLLVPSTVVLLGRWNWWPSRLTQEPSIEA